MRAVTDEQFDALMSDEEAQDMRVAEQRERMQKDFAVISSVANVINGVREYYRDPFQYRENQKMRMFLIQNDQILSGITTPFTGVNNVLE